MLKIWKILYFSYYFPSKWGGGVLRLIIVNQIFFSFVCWASKSGEFLAKLTESETSFLNLEAENFRNNFHGPDPRVKDLRFIRVRIPVVSAHTFEKANKARITIENFYTNFLLQQNEREERFKQTESALGKLLNFQISKRNNSYFIQLRALRKSEKRKEYYTPRKKLNFYV